MRKLSVLWDWNSARHDFWQCLEIFFYCLMAERRGTGIQWVEAKDTAKYPTKHRTPPLSPDPNKHTHTTQIDLAQNINSAEAEKS